MDWLASPLQPTDEFLGIPAFWVQRLVKLAQFVAGSTILFDILGEDRVTGAAQYASSLADRIRAVQMTPGLLAILTRPYGPLDLIVGLVGLYSWTSGINRIIGGLIHSTLDLMILLIVAVAVLIPLLVVAMWALEKFIDSAVSAVMRFLRAERLRTRALAYSYTGLVLAFLLDMAVS